MCHDQLYALPPPPKTNCRDGRMEGRGDGGVGGKLGEQHEKVADGLRFDVQVTTSLLRIQTYRDQLHTHTHTPRPSFLTPVANVSSA